MQKKLLQDISDFQEYVTCRFDIVLRAALKNVLRCPQEHGRSRIGGAKCPNNGEKAGFSPNFLEVPIRKSEKGIRGKYWFRARDFRALALPHKTLRTDTSHTGD